MKHLLYDAVLFDLDGTLTDSAIGITRSVRYALEKMGMPIPDDDVIRKFLGPPLADSFAEFCGMDEESCRRATDCYRERYLTVGWLENAAYPGVRALLAALKKGGAYVAVATGKPQDASERILEAFHLSPYIDRVVGPTMSDLHADKGALIKKALPTRYHSAVMIGDRASDILGAHENGIVGIAAEYGYGSAEELALADASARDVSALQALLGLSSEQKRGFFISVEGLDGCGKSTQIALLDDRLRACGYDVQQTREPGGCKLSEKVRGLLLDRKNVGMCAEAEALLYAASRAQHTSDVILPALAAGRVVLCDRYVDSSIAYQGGGRALGMDCVAGINAPAIHGRLPDATVYLRLPHKLALARRERASELDRIEIEDEAFFARVEAAYELLAQQNAERFITVDAALPPKEIADEVFMALLARMDKAGVA